MRIYDMNIHKYTCIYIYLYIYANIYIHIYIYMYIYVYMCVSFLRQTVFSDNVSGIQVVELEESFRMH